MFKNKKKITSIMVAIFTTFTVLSSTTAGAFTRSAAISVPTALTAAQLSVDSTYFILTTSAYDLAVNQKSLSKANTAMIKAINAVDKLEKSSTDYKRLKGRIFAVIARTVNANKNIVAVKVTEALAATAAEKAIKAVELAPLVTTTDLTAVKMLQVTAYTALDKVRDSDKAIIFNTRLKAVADTIAKL